jgi:hypothetical protein
MAMWTILLTLVIAVSLLLGSYLLLAWRHERVQRQVVVDRLLTEARIQELTAQTLLAMREAARDHFATRSRS